MVVLGIIAYIASATVAMYWTVKICNLEGAPYFDEDYAAVIAIFWPVAFPLYLAYMAAGYKGDKK